MPVSKAQQKATAKYEAKVYDKTLIRLPKGHLDTLKAHAAARGESVNGFIGRAIAEAMERDSGGGTDSRANAAQDAAESVSGVGATPIPSQPETPAEHAQTLAEAKRMVWAAGDVILPSLLRESVAEASRAAGETDDAFLWRAVSAQAEQDREKRKAAVDAADAPQRILIPVVVSLSLDELERVERAAKAAGEGVTEFIRRTIKAQTAAGRKSGGGNAKSGGKGGKHGT